MCDISFDEPLGDIGSLDGDIILHQGIPDVTFDLINLRGQFILFTFEFLQFVQLFLYLFVRAPSVWCDQPSQGICNKDFLSIKMFLLEPDNDNCRGDIYYKCLTTGANNRTTKKNLFSTFLYAEKTLSEFISFWTPSQEDFLFGIRHSLIYGHSTFVAVTLGEKICCTLLT